METQNTAFLKTKKLGSLESGHLMEGGCLIEVVLYNHQFWTI